MKVLSSIFKTLNQNVRDQDFVEIDWEDQKKLGVINFIEKLNKINHGTKRMIKEQVWNAEK